MSAPKVIRLSVRPVRASRRAVVQIDGQVRIVNLVRALEAGGLTLQHDPISGCFAIRPAKEDCSHG